MSSTCARTRRAGGDEELLSSFDPRRTKQEKESNSDVSQRRTIAIPERKGREKQRVESEKGSAHQGWRTAERTISARENTKDCQKIEERKLQVLRGLRRRQAMEAVEDEDVRETRTLVGNRVETVPSHEPRKVNGVALVNACVNPAGDRE